MSIVWFEPQNKKLRKVTEWVIKPHRIMERRIYHYDNTYTDVKCLSCDKSFDWRELTFHAYKDRYDKIQIRPYQVYGERVCFDCGIKHLAEITPKKLLSKLNQLYLEYKNEE